MVDNTLDLQVRVGALGDVDGDERTISQEASDRINEIVSEDLVDRYEDLNNAGDIAVCCVNSPNVAIIQREPADD